MGTMTLCIAPMPTEEALDLAARIADAEDPDCERLLFAEGPQVCDALRCEVLRHAAEVDRLDALLARQHAILTGVADALRGDPGPLASHSHHDLAERAAAMVRERDALRDAARECLDALEAPAPVWDADESEHDEHAARLEVARGALRALVAPR